MTYGIPDRANPSRPRNIVTNEFWPLIEPDGTVHARTIDDKPAGQQIKVRVRLDIHGRQGAWYDGRATRWHGDSVFVVVPDQSIDLHGNGVWVHARDVKRR